VDFDIPFTGKATLAGTVAATAPVIAAFLVLQRYFLQEHRAGGWLGR
jgi:ABC-type glycerol-3-phosphate transport system permease component